MFTTDRHDHDHNHDPEVEGRPARPLLRLAYNGAVIIGCLGFMLVAACSVSLGTDAIESPNDIEVGECLSIGADDEQGKVNAAKVDCERTDGLTFYAASTVAAESGCDAANTSTLTFGENRESLCLTPNFTEGRCYQIPIGGDLVDYREVTCDAQAAEQTVVARAVERGDASITCDADDTMWSFARPQSVGYCLRTVV
ncbi:MULTISPECIES: pyridine nucleotide-disulfide oxidoreductase [unclassified Gordonia (in: high G+C Gram-positive bacteria)]